MVTIARLGNIIVTNSVIFPPPADQGCSHVSKDQSDLVCHLPIFSLPSELTNKTDSGLLHTKGHYYREEGEWAKDPHPGEPAIA